MRVYVREFIVRLDAWDGVSCFGFPVGARGTVCLELLSSEELDRSERIRFAPARRRYLAARTALRVLLADQLGQRPEEVPIQVKKTGKPFLPAHPLHFSLSHAGEWGAIAMSKSNEVGIDIEAPRETRYPAALDRKIPNVPGLGLLDRWTLAESALKSLELGVHALAGLVVVDQGESDTLFAHGEKRTWARPLRFLPCPGYSAAVAVRSATQSEVSDFANPFRPEPAAYPTSPPSGHRP